jgi:hypothetical protein
MIYFLYFYKKFDEDLLKTNFIYFFIKTKHIGLVFTKKLISLESTTFFLKKIDKFTFKY